MIKISDTEYFSNDRTIRFLNMDCNEFMAGLKENEFDLNLSDPNYGISAAKPSIKPCKCKQKNGTVLNVSQPNYKHKEWDDNVVETETINKITETSKNQILFGINYYCTDSLKGGRIVWDKLNGECDQFGCEIAYCSINQRTDVVYYLWSGMFQGIYCGKDARKALVQQGNKQLNETRIHVTQKPVILYRYLLLNYTKPSDNILDCFGGSMSNAIACHMERRKLTIIELDSDYFKSALKRFDMYERQMKLF